MDENLVAVVIPIYKQYPDTIELLSLKQCISILNQHAIVFIASPQLNTDIYQAICEKNIPFKLTTFDATYFNSIDGYNKLMLSPAFYKAFINYKYILIYQLDAYVFKDELVYWCNRNYDFIGAPAVAHQNQPNGMQMLKTYSKMLSFANRILNTNHTISNVGNGGFSLRKTKTFYRLLKLLKPKIANWGRNNEDGFFKYWGNLFFPFFKLPTDEVALHFSVEHNAGDSLKKLGGELPFGCHAFEKYEPETWKKHIQF